MQTADLMGDGTILLVGMPRSGTTWLGKLFDSHPCTLYRHEPDSWKKLTDIPLFPSMRDAEVYGGKIRAFEGSLADISSLKVSGKKPVFRKAYLSTLQYRTYQAGIFVSQLGARLGIDLPVVGAPRRLDAGCRLVWKSIESIGRLGLMLRCLPNATGILLIRHPCGYVASVLRGESKRRFQDNRGASEDYGILQMLLETELAKERNLSIKYFRSRTPEERLAWRWALSNDKALRDTAGSNRCFTLLYEDVCERPVESIQRVFEQTHLDWSSQTETFINQSTGMHLDSYYSVYKDPRKAAYTWRDELDPDCIKRILDIVSSTPPGALYEKDSCAASKGQYRA